ncbi:LuxR C-terminal-related transcriptional regulator [Streptomyces sp. NPDC015127]|uniref:LuxR C-terminal-related transcriptional regulator n=1 Tax=Streptomyces sp. NPDC015127 TaxID=3364939 RepID=UPI0036FE7304
MSVQDRASHWPLVGRVSELSAFSAAWEDPHCKGLVIFGPAGVGKSRLAEECLAQAAHRGSRAARATASASAAAVPLGAIAHVIPAGVDLSDPVQGFAAVARALSGPKRQRWALLIDDLQLLDAASAVLVRQLLDADVVRLIGTARSGEPLSGSAQALTGDPAMQRIDLADMDEAGTEEVLQTILGGPVGLRTLHELYNASGGNMLYLRELVLGAVAAKKLSFSNEVWELDDDRPVATPRLTELIGNRLAGAARAARPVLELLALCEPVPLADAEAASSFEVLADLERAGLVRVMTDRRRTTVSLAHPLYGENLRATTPAPRQREVLLQQAARAEGYGARRRADALHIATWRLAATGTAEPALLVQAAVLARHAHDYQQVIALLDAIPEADHSVISLLLLGESLLEMGQCGRAEEVFVSAYEHAGSEEEELAITMARTFNLFWGLARTDEALTVNLQAQRSLNIAGAEKVLRTDEGAMRAVSGEPLQGLSLLSEMETEIEEAQNANVWLLASMMRTTALAMTGHGNEALEYSDHAYNCHRRYNEKVLVSHPDTQLAARVVALSEVGRLDDARTVGAKFFSNQESSILPITQAWMTFDLGRLEWISGHPVAARYWYAQCVALARVHHVRVLHEALLGLAACAGVLGDAQGAESHIKEAGQYPSMNVLVGEERLSEAWLAVTQGDLAHARAVLSEAAGRARETGHLTSEGLLLTDLARLGGAHEAVGRLAELADECDGMLMPARARLAAALAADDPQRLQGSATELARIGAHLLAAEAAITASVIWRNQGLTRQSTAAAQQAAPLKARCEGAQTPLLAPAEATSSLTSREREIAKLAAAGTSSREIAEILTLSVRTIDNHLQRIYGKLGITTRKQLAQAIDYNAP